MRASMASLARHIAGRLFTDGDCPIRAPLRAPLSGDRHAELPSATAQSRSRFTLACLGDSVCEHCLSPSLGYNATNAVRLVSRFLHELLTSPQGPGTPVLVRSFAQLVPLHTIVSAPLRTTSSSTAIDCAGTISARDRALAFRVSRRIRGTVAQNDVVWDACNQRARRVLRPSRARRECAHTGATREGVALRLKPGSAAWAGN